MFDTKAVAQRIRRARNEKNMTQMALADEMGVSFQAVSNWERGNSMPDIAKLEQLCAVLGLSIYELLGSDSAQARTVVRLQQEEPLPDTAELAEVAPLVPPEKLREAVRRQRPDQWPAIVSMAPFLDEEMLAEVVERCQEPPSMEMILALAPFLGSETLETLASRADDLGDRDMLLGLAPFLESDALGRIAWAAEDRCDLKTVGALAPFLEESDLAKLVVRRLDAGDSADCVELYPFLDSETMRKLVRALMDQGDFDAMREAAPFL